MNIILAACALICCRFPDDGGSATWPIPNQISNLHRAISERDNQALVRAAHSLKGSVSNFAATAAHELARRLETMGRNNDLAQPDRRARVEQACAALETETARLESVLFALLGEEVA